MLGIEYFGNLEHHCFKKNVISGFFSRSVTYGQHGDKYLSQQKSSNSTLLPCQITGENSATHMHNSKIMCDQRHSGKRVFSYCGSMDQLTQNVIHA